MWGKRLMVRATNKSFILTLAFFFSLKFLITPNAFEKYSILPIMYNESQTDFINARIGGHHENGSVRAVFIRNCELLKNEVKRHGDGVFIINPIGALYSILYELKSDNVTKQRKMPYEKFFVREVINCKNEQCAVSVQDEKNDKCIINNFGRIL